MRLPRLLKGRRAVIVASTDLSHYQKRRDAARLDDKVIHQVVQFDADGLMSLLETNPEHACGGGPTVSVMRAAKALGATDARVLKYGDSGDVSGDKDAVVGYLAAAFGTFAPAVGECRMLRSNSQESLAPARPRCDCTRDWRGTSQSRHTPRSLDRYCVGRRVRHPAHQRRAARLHRISRARAARSSRSSSAARCRRRSRTRDFRP